MNGMNKLWKISWLEYKGWDCNGHIITGIFNGTKEEAIKYAAGENEGGDYEIEAVEFDIKSLEGKGLVF
jgi:hypothetical protein